MRPDPTMKYISPEVLYETIYNSEIKIFKVTYCSLKLNDQYIIIKKNIIKIVKTYKDIGFIEGTILKDNEPLEDIILKYNRILKIECLK